MHQDIKFYYGNFLFLVVPELDDGDGKVEVTESVPLTAEALETLFWQQFQTTATQTSGCQTPENVQIDEEKSTQTDITSLVDPDSAVSYF